MERHGKYLWGHIIKLPEEAGNGIKLVDRTNNALESFFHKVKLYERRRGGRKILTQDFENIPPAATLVMNYTQPDYIQMTCGTQNKLPLCFSRIDKERKAHLLYSEKREPDNFFNSDNPTGQLSVSDRKFVRKEAVCDWIFAAAEGKSISVWKKKKSVACITVDKKFSQLLQQVNV